MTAQISQLYTVSVYLDKQFSFLAFKYKVVSTALSFVKS